MIRFLKDFFTYIGYIYVVVVPGCYYKEYLSASEALEDDINKTAFIVTIRRRFKIVI